jgi:hypothetical protein
MGILSGDDLMVMFVFCYFCVLVAGLSFSGYDLIVLFFFVLFRVLTAVFCCDVLVLIVIVWS